MGKRLKVEARTVEDLINAILEAQDGDIIVVWSDWEKSVGEEFVRQRRPDIRVSFEVESGGAAPPEYAPS